MKTYLKLFLFLLLIISCSKSITEPRMINVKRFFIAYGIKDGVFQGSMNLSPDDYAIVIFNFYFDAGWFYVCNNQKGYEKKILEDEVPATKEGALKVASLLLFRYVEGYRKNNESFKRSFTYLKQEISKEYTSDYEGCTYTHTPIIITDEEIYTYYSQAIRNKINSLSIKLLTTEEQNGAKELLHAYCVDPTEKSMNGLKEFKAELLKQNKKKEEAFISFVKELSPVISEMVLKE